MVRDIKVGAIGSLPRDIVNVRGGAFFSAQDGTHGRELWKSDGTFRVTYLVKDVDPSRAARASDIHDLTNFNGTLFFVADDPVHGIEVWRSDGTSAGTSLLTDLNDQKEFGWQGAGWLTPVGDRIYFSEQTNGELGFNLYVTDGSTSGTTGGFVDSAFDLVAFLGQCFFIRGTNPGWLAKSDGTRAGTVDVFLPSAGGGKKSWIRSLTPVGTLLFFVAGDGIGGATGQELWASDGTTAGSYLVKDINPSGQSYPQSLTDLNGELIFQATTHPEGAELWRSDGTEAGTTLVSDIAPGEASSSPTDITARGNVVFFRANDGVHGTELWRSDGTPSGTVIVADIA
jgi:ELWxxDGT repeat protein